ncbi:MAG: RuBisCO large subunit C-terminal-like domain-containing protein [Rhodothermales bacterium]
MEYLEAVYQITGSGPFDDRVDAILLEQTIETPRSVAERYPHVRDNMMGRVVRIESCADRGVQATLALPFVTASVDPAQFLNVLFGNSSLHEGVKLVDFTPPAGVTELLPGPRFGVDGLRSLTNAERRPITCSALKPVGMTLKETAHVCKELAMGGIDLVKDDHYLADHSFAPFDERVRVCQAVVEEAAAQTGRSCVYVPNLSGTPDQLKRQAAAAQKAGVRAVMMAPMLIGMPTFHEMIRSEMDLPVLAHPSFGGVASIRPATIYGKLFRLFGADAVIFANYGGRFSFSPDVCRDIAERLRNPWLGLKPAFPVPAGGMTADRAAELVRFFGRDVILLVGGSLLKAGDRLRQKTRQFTERVEEAADDLPEA